MTTVALQQRGGSTQEVVARAARALTWLNIADAVFTLIIVKGLHVPEWNPVVRYALVNTGLFLFLKFGSVGLLGAILRHLGARRALILANICYGLVVMGEAVCVTAWLINSA